MQLHQVSVVIPALNAEGFVADAIRSVLAQTHAPVDIIVIDDGSTDGTASIARQFGVQVRCVSQPNRGLSSARNRGIKESSGEFVAFLDADDMWAPTKLEKQIALLGNDPNIAVVHTDTCRLTQSTGRIDQFPANRQEFVGKCWIPLWHGNRIGVSSVLVRRSVLQEHGGFDEEIRRPTTQDYDLWLRLARHVEFGFVAEPLHVARFHQANASRNKVAMIEDTIYVLQKELARHRMQYVAAGVQDPDARIGHEYAQLANAYLQNNLRSSARKAILRYLRHFPKDRRAWHTLYKSCWT